MDAISKKLNYIKTHLDEFTGESPVEGTDSKCFHVGSMHCLVVLKRKHYKQGVDNDKYIEKLEAMRPALERLRAKGVHVPRHFGFFSDDEGNLYSVQLKMPGENFLPTPFGREQCGSSTEEKLDRLLNAPEEHYIKFVKDIKAIIDEGIYIDFANPANIRYDPNYGFSFVDLAPLDNLEYIVFKNNHRELTPYYLAQTFDNAFACEIENAQITKKYKKVFLRFMKTFYTNGYPSAERVAKSPSGIWFFEKTKMCKALKNMFEGMKKLI